MPDITVALSDEQRRELEEAARQAGMTVESYAAEAVSRAVEVRYVLPSTQGSVSPIQTLKRDKK
jgi:molecular chaperone DnaK (HSP70)